jgi:predicted membrane-bound spermidine synthase
MNKPLASVKPEPLIHAADMSTSVVLRFALCGLFSLSGFCGLIYESVWAHYLKLFLGHAAYAQTVVLVTFIGGMAIGAAICGRLADQIARPLVAYAAVELLIGLGGVLFHSIFVATTDWAYSSLLPAACSADGPCLASWLFTAALLFPQSILLGMTFPLMVTGFLRASQVGSDPGSQVSLLYFLNSIGAVVGVLAATFVLVPSVGLPGTTLTAGLLNVIIAIAVYGVAKYIPASAFRPRSAVLSDRDKAHEVGLLLAVACFTGLSSFVYEIVWIRMLSLVLGSSTHAFELMLASFILGLSLGSLWVRKRIDRSRDVWGFLGRVQLLMGLLAVATLSLYGWTFDVMGATMGALARNATGYVLFNFASAVICIAVMLPATFLAGMTLPVITLLLLRSHLGERSVGFVYSANTVGSIIGVIAGFHVLVPIFGLRVSLLTAGAIDIALGLVLFAYAKKVGRPSTASRSIAIAATAGFLIVAVTAPIDPLRTASGVFRTAQTKVEDGATVPFHRDGKTATVDVVQLPDGLVSIRTNGKPDAAIRMVGGEKNPGSDEQTMVFLGALPLAFRPHATEFALIGFGSGLSTSTVLGSASIKSVETIEIEPAMVAGANAFRPLVDRAYVDPRSRIVFDDAKAHFARAKRRYDVIISEPSNPWVSGVSSLFTTEFYARVREHINDDGLFVQWLHVYEFNSGLLASITRGMGAAFRDYVMYQASGADLVVLASPNKVVGEPSAQVFAMPEVSRLLARVGVNNLADLEMHRVGGRGVIEKYLARISTPANSDFFPIVDQNATKARFIGSAANEVLQIREAPIPIIELFEHRPLRVDGGLTDFVVPELPHGRGVDAQAWSQYVLAPRRPDSVARDDATVSQFAVVTRAVFVDCLPLDATEALWDQVVLFAAKVNPVLPRTVAGPLWAKLATSDCAAKLSAKSRTWVALFRAVGERDPVRMASLADQLLEARGNSSLQLEYLIAAAATGLLVQSDRSGARAVLEPASKVIPAVRAQQPWMDFLRAWAADQG